MQRSGKYLNSVKLAFYNQGSLHKSVGFFLQTYNQGLRLLFSTVSLDFLS